MFTAWLRNSLGIGNGMPNLSLLQMFWQLMHMVMANIVVLNLCKLLGMVPNDMLLQVQPAVPCVSHEQVQLPSASEPAWKPTATQCSEFHAVWNEEWENCWEECLASTSHLTG